MMSDMVLWREPTPSEAQVISRQATREVVSAVAISLLISALICPVAFFAEYEHLLAGNWFRGISALVSFGGFAALMAIAGLSNTRWA